MDMNDDYSHAGPGFKRRAKREKLARSAKPKPCLQKPEYENRKAKRIEMSEAYQNARGIKKRIRHLVLDHDMSYLDACETMRQQGYSITGLTISNIRAEMREILRMLLEVGLIDRDDLARYRRQFMKKQARAREE